MLPGHQFVSNYVSFDFYWRLKHVSTGTYRFFPGLFLIFGPRSFILGLITLSRNGSVHLFGLVFGFKAGAAHRVDALGVERMPSSEVRLCELFAFAVVFYCCVVVAQFLVLFTNAKM